MNWPLIVTFLNHYSSLTTVHKPERQLLPMHLWSWKWYQWKFCTTENAIFRWNLPIGTNGFALVLRHIFSENVSKLGSCRSILNWIQSKSASIGSFVGTDMFGQINYFPWLSNIRTDQLEELKFYVYRQECGAVKIQNDYFSTANVSFWMEFTKKLELDTREKIESGSHSAFATDEWLWAKKKIHQQN